MRRTAIITLVLVLGAESIGGAGSSANAANTSRAYYRVETAAARERLAPFIIREFRDGIVCAAVPSGALDVMATTPGLTLVGPETVYRPEPFTMEDLRGPAAGPGRACTLPPRIPAVGGGIRAMYEDPNLTQTWGGAGVKVAVLDGGVAPHPDLVGRLAKCADLTPSGVPSCADPTSHGTLVASIIAADGGADGLGMRGMAPEASIYSYRVCDSGECWGSYIAAAIYAAIDDGVNIINLSLTGTGHDAVVQAAIDEARAHNILVIASGGNSPPYSHLGYPAVYPEVVSVGAIQESRAPWAFSAPGFNNGNNARDEREIEMAGPGAAVLAAMADGCYVLASGTSLAAPHVSGLAAKLWNGDAEATRTRLQNSARAHDLHTPGEDPLTGLGLPTVTPLFTIHATASPGGSIGPDGAVPVAAGATRAFTITPSATCNQILDVKVDGVSQGPVSSYTFANVAANHAIAATFSTQGTRTIQASASAGGSISPSGITSLGCGGSQTYTITAFDRCHPIVDVKVDGVSQGPIKTYTFAHATSNHTIVATFQALGPFTINSIQQWGATIVPSGYISVPCGASQTFTVTPDHCYRIGALIVDNSQRAVASSYTFTNVMANHAIWAWISGGAGNYGIQASAGAGGTISPNGHSMVACGTSKSYSITPDACSRIETVMVDGVPNGAVSNYTFTDVTANHTIHATFSAQAVNVKANARASGRISGSAGPPCGGGAQAVAAAEEPSLAAIADAPVEPTLGLPVPNPATGPVRLRYGVPAPSAVRLSVLDLQGRQVAVLAEGTRPAGWSWATWDGVTRGGRAPGGVYFLRLQAGGRNIVQRFALVR